MLQGTQYHFATLVYLHACFFHDAVLFNKPASAMKENDIAYSTSCGRVICKMQCMCQCISGSAVIYPESCISNEPVFQRQGACFTYSLFMAYSLTEEVFV